MKYLVSLSTVLFLPFNALANDYSCLLYGRNVPSDTHIYIQGEIAQSSFINAGDRWMGCSNFLNEEDGSKLFGCFIGGDGDNFSNAPTSKALLKKFNGAGSLVKFGSEMLSISLSIDESFYFINCNLGARE